MNEKEINRFDQYNLLIPCYFTLSIDIDPQKCRMNLQIKLDSFEIRLFKYDTFQNIDVHFNQWKFIRLQENIVCFYNEGDQIDLILFFINDTINFKRFLFSLAEAGLIVPLVSPGFNDNDFLFVQTPSFIPTSCYSYSTKLNILTQVKNVTQSQMIFILEKENIIPFNKNYIDYVMPFEIKETNKQIDENREHHQKIWTKLKESNCGSILDFFFKKMKLDDSLFEETYQLMIKSQFSPVTDDPVLEKNINDIDKDKVRMVNDDESRKWTPNLCSICSIICKMHVLKSGIRFVQGQFEVAKKVALLMRGESFAPGDDTELPEKYQEMFNYNEESEINDNFDFVKYLFAIYEFLFNSFEDKDQSANIEIFVNKTSEEALKAIKRFLPKVAPFFIVHKMNTFLFFNQFYSTIFCKTIKNIWPVWILLKMMRDQEKAYPSFSAAILYVALPYLLEKKVQDEERLKEINPDNFELDNKIEELVKVSTFLYKCYNSLQDE